MNINNTTSPHIRLTPHASKNNIKFAAQGPDNAATKLAGSLNDLESGNVATAGLTKKLKEFLSDLGTTHKNIQEFISALNVNGVNNLSKAFPNDVHAVDLIRWAKTENLNNSSDESQIKFAQAQAIAQVLGASHNNHKIIDLSDLTYLVSLPNMIFENCPQVTEIKFPRGSVVNLPITALKPLEKQYILLDCSKNTECYITSSGSVPKDYETSLININTLPGSTVKTDKKRFFEKSCVTNFINLNMKITSGPSCTIVNLNKINQPKSSLGSDLHIRRHGDDADANFKLIDDNPDILFDEIK